MVAQHFDGEETRRRERASDPTRGRAQQPAHGTVDKNTRANGREDEGEGEPYNNREVNEGAARGSLVASRG